MSGHLSVFMPVSENQHFIYCMNIMAILKACEESFLQPSVAILAIRLQSGLHIEADSNQTVDSFVSILGFNWHAVVGINCCNCILASQVYLCITTQAEQSRVSSSILQL